MNKSCESLTRYAKYLSIINMSFIVWIFPSEDKPRGLSKTALYWDYQEIYFLIIIVFDNLSKDYNY